MADHQYEVTGLQGVKTASACSRESVQFWFR